jgi:putative toxin-antitoxin system antitoxin component (TIGR02293 family)
MGHMASTAGPDVDLLRRFFREGAPGPNAHVVLLGLSAFDTFDLVDAIQKGFRYQTFERFRRNIALPVETIMALVNIPRRTLTRRKLEGRFAPEESDRLVRASRVYSKALQLFDGDSRAASHWLVAPQRGLGGQIPVAVSSTDVGAREVERLIDRLEHGVFG